MSDTVLLADLSADAHVTLALTQAGHRHKKTQSFECNSTEEFHAAVTGFMASQANPALLGAAVSACGWEKDGGLAMPNNPYQVRRDWLKDLLQVKRLHLVNDCVSKAMALGEMQAGEARHILGPDANDSYVRALMGASQGLGTSAIITDDLGRLTVLPCEGGHTDLTDATPRERAVRDIMAKRFDHVSRERAVSLQGLVNIWQSLRELEGYAPEAVAPRVIADRSREGDALAGEAVRLCLSWLAATAADVALMLGARGGIYLSGTLIDMLGDQLDIEAFKARFCDKGRLTAYLEDVPVFILRMAHPELVGLSTLFP
ncbi:MAG: glucokinase [Asticcacaulis sp.]